MNKGAKINAFLLSIGASAEFAYIEAQRLETALKGSKSATSAPKRARSEGLCAAEPLSERIMTYARKRKGNTWSLSTLALALGVTGKNAISAQITHLVKSGALNRTGRAEYSIGPNA